MLGRLFGRRSSGPTVVERHDESVCFCSDPNLVPWPDYYRTVLMSDGQIVPDGSRRAVWVEDLSVDGNGRFEDAV